MSLWVKVIRSTASSVPQAPQTGVLTVPLPFFGLEVTGCDFKNCPSFAYSLAYPLLDEYTCGHLNASGGTIGAANVEGTQD